MALEAGGYAEKFGNRYEANWVAYQLLRLLEEKIAWITVEAIGDDEVGVDVVIGTHDNQQEHHQCKVGIVDSEHWTFALLNKLKILRKALYQIERGVTTFHLVSPLPSKKIDDLSTSALNSNMVADDFIKYQINASKERKKNFGAICNYLGFDVAVESDIQKAIYFLQKFKITPYIINQHTKNELEDKASALFLGNPVKLLSFLKNYPVEFNKLRTKITPYELLKDLEHSGFEPKIVPDDSRISPVVDSLTAEFEDSIKPFLISDTLIPRNELNLIIDSIEDKAVTLIKAEAGMGKSALLLELHNNLKDKNIISVPIRLDRRRPEHNANLFGQSLGFPFSPIHSLNKFSSERKIVIILDQLDAIRWTATHSNNALDVCRELVRQAISLRKEGRDISIVIASRDFDTNEDVALSSWLKGISENLFEIKLANLDENTVGSLISPYEVYSSLAEEKKRILRIPLWLGIYLTIAQRTQSAPQFNNKLELVRNFWENRLKQVREYNVTEQDAKQLINKIVVLMTSKSRLSISENMLESGSKRILDILLSVGLLSKQNQQISFRHQALFDYQVGAKLFEAGYESPQKLLSEIGGIEKQTLTKREHLKYALNMLLDAGQQEFCTCATEILFSEGIRFHLKHLVLNAIREISSLKAPSKLLIDRIIAEPQILKKFLSTSCYQNYCVMNYLSENGRISKWLHSDNNDLINSIIHLLSSVAKVAPKLVINELKPFIDLSEQWNERAYSALPWNIEDDSDDIFELRKELLNLGCSANYVDWKSMAKKFPLRTLSLIELIIEHYREVSCETLYSFGEKNIKKVTDRDGWTDDELQEIKELAKVIPKQAIKLFFNYIDSILEQQQDEYMVYAWLSNDRHTDYHSVSSIRKGILMVIEASGQELQSQPNELLNLLTPYMGKLTNPIITHLTAKLLLNLSYEHADLVINWILTEPSTRLACGNTYIEPEWILPGKLITKFSPYCSKKLFSKLENIIYLFPSTKEIEQIKRRLELRNRGIYYSYWGETQYFLLPSLANNRISNKARSLIPVLERKFLSYNKSDFYHALDIKGGLITSPIPIGNKLSNKSWNKLILASDLTLGPKEFIQISENVASEASTEQFANTLESSVRNEPTRFAHFALSLPQDIHKNYIDAFFRGLHKSDVKQVDDDYKEKWKPCSTELLEQVIFHFNNENCEYYLVRLLESRADDWSEKTRNLLIKLAKFSKNPTINKLTVWNTKKCDDTNFVDANSLYGTTINCVRGIAYNGIAKIFWSNESYAIQNLNLVDHAIHDKHPAVNMAAISLLTHLFNYNNDYAHNKFIELCHKDLRMTCGRNAYYFFNQGFEGHHQTQYVDLVLRMLKSVFDDVRKEAARQIYARWFFYDLFDAQIELILQGDSTLKSGCASVVSQFLKEDKYHDRVHKIEHAYQLLINDENDKILKKIGGCVISDNYWLKHNSDKLFSFFINSKAAIFCLYELFRVLESFPKSISNLSTPLLQLVKNITSNTHENNQRVHIRDTSLLTVLQRLYDEATEDEDKTIINTCLDIWDELLQSEMYSAISAINQIDKGLLN